MGFSDWLRNRERKRAETLQRAYLQTIAVNDEDLEDLRLLLKFYNEELLNLIRLLARLKVDMNYYVYKGNYAAEYSKHFMIYEDETSYNYMIQTFHEAQLKLEKIKESDISLVDVANRLEAVLTRRGKKRQLTTLERNILTQRLKVIDYLRRIKNEIEEAIELILNIGEIPKRALIWHDLVDDICSEDKSLTGLREHLKATRDVDRRERFFNNYVSGFFREFVDHKVLRGALQMKKLCDLLQQRIDELHNNLAHLQATIGEFEEK